MLKLRAEIFFYSEFFCKVRKNFEKELLGHSAHLKDINRLPENGWSKDEILKQTKIYLGLGEFDWTQGTQSGTVYNGTCFFTVTIQFPD
jgi:hypothetical protein